jgi:4-hydroxy-tetrahydrodipicolinate reductase
MKIGLIGYGKMGQEIEKICSARNHEIALKVQTANRQKLQAEDLREMDMIIEFSVPEAAVKNIRLCFEAKIPVVVGTTGWYGQREQIKAECIAGNHSMVVGSNFSLGVNIFFAINRRLAEIMNRFPQYEPSITEEHHAAKLDRPSGTAITIAEDIILNNERKSDWKLDSGSDRTNLIITSIREGNIPGTHTVTYSSDVDAVELKHTAFGRAGFALGAVLAAEWLLGKKGFFEVQECFSI